MSRENGGVIGTVNPTTFNKAVGMFNSKTQVLANSLQQWPRSGNQAILGAMGATPYVVAYQWSDSLGFGFKYSGPSTLPTGAGSGINYEPNTKTVLVSHNVTPFISAYPWTASNGLGTKYSDPASPPAGNGQRSSFSPSGNVIVVGHNTTPFISAYQWTTSGFGTKYSDPGTIPGGSGSNDISFHPSGTDLIVGTGTNIFAYQWSYSSGFGTQYAAPATSDGSTQSTEFNSNGTDFFAGSTRTSNYLSAYSYSIGIGWGTRYTNPGTSYPTSTVYDTVYNSVYNSLAWVSNAGAYGGYNWINSVNWGSALSTTTALPVVANLSLAFNNNGNIAFLGSGGTMGIYAFPYSTAGFGAKYSDPTYLPPTSAILNQLVSITS